MCFGAGLFSGCGCIAVSEFGAKVSESEFGASINASVTSTTRWCTDRHVLLQPWLQSVADCIVPRADGAGGGGGGGGGGQCQPESAESAAAADRGGCSPRRRLPYHPGSDSKVRTIPSFSLCLPSTNKQLQAGGCCIAEADTIGAGGHDAIFGAAVFGVFISDDNLSDNNCGCSFAAATAASPSQECSRIV